MARSTLPRACRKTHVKRTDFAVVSVGRDPETGTELGEVLLDQRPGRRSEDELMVCKTMSHAMEDMVVAQLAYRRPKRKARAQQPSCRWAGEQTTRALASDTTS